MTTLDTHTQVLLIDDDPEMRALMRLHLEGAGYRVVSAEDAVAAGHAVVKDLPDLIIADFKMPYMDGDEFIGALPEVQVRRWLENAVPSESKQRVAEAKEAFDAAQRDEAAAILEDVLRGDPANAGAQASKVAPQQIDLALAFSCKVVSREICGDVRISFRVPNGVVDTVRDSGQTIAPRPQQPIEPVALFG